MKDLTFASLSHTPLSLALASPPPSISMSQSLNDMSTPISSQIQSPLTPFSYPSPGRTFPAPFFQQLEAWQSASQNMAPQQTNTIRSAHEVPRWTVASYTERIDEESFGLEDAIRSQMDIHVISWAFKNGEASTAQLHQLEECNRIIKRSRQKIKQPDDPSPSYPDTLPRKYTESLRMNVDFQCILNDFNRPTVVLTASLRYELDFPEDLPSDDKIEDDFFHVLCRMHSKFFDARFGRDMVKTNRYAEYLKAAKSMLSHWKSESEKRIVFGSPSIWDEARQMHMLFTISSCWGNLVIIRGEDLKAAPLYRGLIGWVRYDHVRGIVYLAAHCEKGWTKLDLKKWMQLEYQCRNRSPSDLYRLSYEETF